MISEQQDRKAMRRLRCRKQPSSPRHPTRTLSLGSATTVTLTQKYGVWFVTAVAGAMQLRDFVSFKDGWGDTELAVQRAARRLGLDIFENAPKVGARVRAG